MQNKQPFATALSSRKILAIGIFICGIFIAVFGIWAAMAPLNSAAIASGKLVIKGDKTLIQHLEGGIISEVVVTAGQVVHPGDLLVAFDTTATSASLAASQIQLLDSLALQTRLMASQNNQEVDFSQLQEIYKLSPELDNIIANHSLLAVTNRNNFANQLQLLDEKILVTEQEIIGLQAQQVALQATDKLLIDEQNILNNLASNNTTFIEKNRLAQQIAANKGSMGQVQAQIAQARQSIVATKLEKVQLQLDQQQYTLDQLTQLSVAIEQLKQQIHAYEDVIKRSKIHAPFAAVVMDVKHKHTGAVVAGGEQLMYLVPQEQQIVISAQILPQDIDLVVPNLVAKILLTSYKTKKVPKLSGKVLTVSADSLVNQQTGQEYFAATISIDSTELASLVAEVNLYPGMPVQVFVMAQGRSLLNYLIAPFIDAAYQAFREE